jgi:hypothetical protein
LLLFKISQQSLPKKSRVCLSQKNTCWLDELSDFSDKPKKLVSKPLVNTIAPIAQQMYIKSFSIPRQQIGPT